MVQKSGHQLRLAVEIPLFMYEIYISFRWLALGFQNHQAVAVAIRFQVVICLATQDLGGLKRVHNKKQLQGFELIKPYLLGMSRCWKLRING